MSLIQIQDLTFGYEGSYDNVFEHVSFQIDTDWKLGLIGRNGRGKTTLLCLLQKKYTYTGTISSGVEFNYFPFPVEDPERDVLAVAGEVCPAAQDWELLRECSLLDLEEDIPWRDFSTLSSGEKTKVLLAAMFLNEGRFLLIDEPTNHLDAAAREILGEYLSRKKGFLLVSHDRALLDRCTDHILSINRADIQVQKGNYSVWRENRNRQDQFEAAEQQKLQRESRQLSQAARQTAGWSDKLEHTKYGTRNSGLRPDRGYIGHQSAKMMKRAKSIEQRRERAAEEARSLLKNAENTADLAIHPLTYHRDQMVCLEGVSVAYSGEPVFQGLDLVVRQGERVALEGKNGCGKSSVLRLLLGQNIPHTGSVAVGSGLILSYLSQNTDSLRGGFSQFAGDSEIEESLFKAILRKLDFSRTQFDKDLAELSGGQKKKILLARSLCQEAHIYLWDEPLNFIDLLSRIQIEELILRHRPTLLFVEHDRAFVEAVATRRVILGKDGSP